MRCGIVGMILTSSDPAAAIRYRRHRPSGAERWRYLTRIAQQVASTPNGLDIGFAVRRLCQLFAQMADKHIDDLDLRLVNSAVQVREKHLLGHCDAFAADQQL